MDSGTGFPACVDLPYTSACIFDCRYILQIRLMVALVGVYLLPYKVSVRLDRKTSIQLKYNKKISIRYAWIGQGHPPEGRLA